MREQELNNECTIQGIVEIVAVPGSNYKGVFRNGAPVALQWEESSGKVAVTRGNGAVKVGYVVDSDADEIAACLALGYRCCGHIDGVVLVGGAKHFRVALEPPFR